MPLTKEDNILIKNLFELKGYNTRHLVRVSQKKLKCQQCLHVVATLYGLLTVVFRADCPDHELLNKRCSAGMREIRR